MKVIIDIDEKDFESLKSYSVERVLKNAYSRIPVDNEDDGLDACAQDINHITMPVVRIVGSALNAVRMDKLKKKISKLQKICVVEVK